MRVRETGGELTLFGGLLGLVSLVGLGAMAMPDFSASSAKVKIEEIKKLIDKHDKNQDGRLSQEESMELIQSEYKKYGRENNLIQEIDRMRCLGFQEASESIFLALKEIKKRQNIEK